MLLKIIVLLFTLCAVNAAPSFESRIVGGENAELGEYPYVVSLQIYGSHTCGASILSDQWVLTAAHCIYGNENNPGVYNIQYGVVDIQSQNNKIQVAEIVGNSNYSPGGSYANDVAVLRLSEKIQLGPNAQPVQLADSNDVPGDNPDAILVGWGYIFDGSGVMRYLQKVTITLFNDDICEAAEFYYNRNVHVCAGITGGGKGQCSGDSGGPLAVNGKQYGVVSWSVKPCSSAGHPGVFAKVTQYREWIREQTGV